MTERKNKKSAYARGISFILTFFLAVLVLSLLFLVQLNLGLGSSQNLKNSINNSDYTQEAYREVLAKSKTYIKERSMPAKIVTKAVTKERFYVDSSKSIKAALGGQSCQVDTTDLEKSLRRNINQYFNEHGIIKDDDIIIAREEIVQTVSGYYKSCVQFRFGEFFYPLHKNLDRVSPIAIPLLAVLTGLTSLVLIKIQKFRHRGFRYLSYGLFSAILANLVIWVKLFFFDRVNKGVETAYYLEFSNDYLRSGMYAAAVITAVGIVLFLITALFANRHKLAGKVS